MKKIPNNLMMVFFSDQSGVISSELFPVSITPLTPEKQEVHCISRDSGIDLTETFLRARSSQISWQPRENDPMKPRKNEGTDRKDNSMAK